MDRIELTDVAFPCIIGLNAWERTRPQRLSLTLSLGVPLDPAAGGDLGRSVDYRGVLCDARFIAERGRFELLESLGVAIARHLLSPPAACERRAAVQHLRLSLRKPEAWAEQVTPGITLERDVAGAPPEAVERFEHHEVHRLLSTPGTVVERFIAEPGAALPALPGAIWHLVAGTLSQGGHAVTPHTALPGDAELLSVGNAGAVLLRLHGPAVVEG